MNSSSIKVGIIGCGMISNTYIKHCKTFPILEIVHCADRNPERSAAKAAEYGIPQHGSVEQLLADSEVDLVVNLTTPRGHASVNLAAIAAGKHVFCVKPFSINLDEGLPVLAAARAKGVLIGCAPDTFFGPPHQTCRKLIDDGAIGAPVAAVAFMACHGWEDGHPNPAFYYDIGGGPMFDMGPYYLAALVNLMGPMKRVSGSAKITSPTRTLTKPSHPLYRTQIEVKAPTHLSGTIDFQNGAIATVMMSFDVWAQHLPCIEIYGTEGTLVLPGIGTGGEVLLRRSEHREWRNMPITHTSICSQGAAIADMAYALREGRAHRANGEMACHLVDAMQAFEDSSREGRHVELSTTCAQPAALSPGLEVGVIG